LVCFNLSIFYLTLMYTSFFLFIFFFFNATATTEIYTLSLHDALPIFPSMVPTTLRTARSRGGHVLSRQPDELSMSARRAFLPLMSPRSAMLSSLSIVAGCRRSAEQNQWNEEERQTEERDFFCAAANNYRSRSYEMSSLSFGHSLINLP